MFMIWPEAVRYQAPAGGYKQGYLSPARQLNGGKKEFSASLNTSMNRLGCGTKASAQVEMKCAFPKMFLPSAHRIPIALWIKFSLAPHRQLSSLAAVRRAARPRRFCGKTGSKAASSSSAKKTIFPTCARRYRKHISRAKSQKRR